MPGAGAAPPTSDGRQRPLRPLGEGGWEGSAPGRLTALDVSGSGAARPRGAGEARTPSRGTPGRPRGSLRGGLGGGGLGVGVGGRHLAAARRTRWLRRHVLRSPRCCRGVPIASAAIAPAISPPVATRHGHPRRPQRALRTPSHRRGPLPLVRLSQLPEVGVPKRLPRREPVVRVVCQKALEEIDAIRRNVGHEPLKAGALLRREGGGLGG